MRQQGLFLRNLRGVSADVGCWNNTQAGRISLLQPWMLEVEVRGLADLVGPLPPADTTFSLCLRVGRASSGLSFLARVLVPS